MCVRTLSGTCLFLHMIKDSLYSCGKRTEDVALVKRVVKGQPACVYLSTHWVLACVCDRLATSIHFLLTMTDRL